LPWAGCSILAAPAATITTIREKAAEASDVYVAVMPMAAQTTRVYDEYLQQVAVTKSADFEPSAISVVGPRNKIDKFVRKLPLLA
jgi:hypothetical protein